MTDNTTPPDAGGSGTLVDDGPSGPSSNTPRSTRTKSTVGPDGTTTDVTGPVFITHVHSTTGGP